MSPEPTTDFFNQRMNNNWAGRAVEQWCQQRLGAWWIRDLRERGNW